MKVKEILHLLKKDGWYICRTKGSHRQLKNDRLPGTVTVAGRLTKDLHPAILQRINQQANKRKNEPTNTTDRTRKSRPTASVAVPQEQVKPA